MLWRPSGCRTQIERTLDNKIEQNEARFFCFIEPGGNRLIVAFSTKNKMPQSLFS